VPAKLLRWANMAIMSPLAAALSMQQPMVPSSRAQIAPTDVLGAYNLSANMANNQYLAKLQQQNALWGGLAGIGGAGLEGYMLKGGLFGANPATAAAATNAATAGAPAASAAAPAAFDAGSSAIPFLGA